MNGPSERDLDLLGGHRWTYELTPESAASLGDRHCLTKKLDMRQPDFLFSVKEALLLARNRAAVALDALNKAIG